MISRIKSWRSNLKRTVLGNIMLLHGVIAEEQVLVKAPIGRDGANRKNGGYGKMQRRRDAVYSVKRYSNHTLVDATLNGRTHQIRVHAAHLASAIGDKPTAIKRPVLAGQLLHAYKLDSFIPNRSIYGICYAVSITI